jgi:hypothetical protein
MSYGDNSTHVFAVPGQGHIIDVVNPATGRTWINGHDAVEIAAREPGAVLMTWETFLSAKAARQHTPIRWDPSTAEQYDEMLNVLPPVDWTGSAFMVGEPDDHDAATGAARFRAYRQRDDRYEVANRPMTRAEFRAERDR